MQAIRVAVPCKAFAVKVIDLSVTQAAPKPRPVPKLGPFEIEPPRVSRRLF